MTSVALQAWRSTRANRLDRLQSAHTAIGGSGPGRRWVTEELNHALILRPAAEFQGFARDLHNEVAAGIASALAGGVPERDDVLMRAFTTTRRLNRGNAGPDVLKHDLGLLGLELWTMLERRNPTRASQWRERLARLNEARNGLAHSDQQKIESIVAAGWPLTLRSVRRWRSTLDLLATGVDRVAGEHLRQVFGVGAW
jgi:hypothetical protein